MQTCQLTAARRPSLAVLAVACLAFSVAARADSAADGMATDPAGLANRWLSVADAAKESQPHWMTPLATVTPRLEQEFRYDQGWQDRGNGARVLDEGGNKGLELIPAARVEVILGVPDHRTVTTRSGSTHGWTDETLLVKYRLISANEEHGNRIVSAFLGMSLPTGSPAFSSRATIVTPTLAAGKGWGTRASGYDVQTTIGIAIPSAYERRLGTPIAWNTAFQAHVLGKLWPEIEANAIYFRHGPDDGRTQLALTVGTIAGRYAIGRRALLIVGGGYQRAVSSFRTFRDTWLLTVRVGF